MKKFIYVGVLFGLLAGCVTGASMTPCVPPAGKTICEEFTVTVEALNESADAGVDAEEYKTPVTRHAN